jgi:hypothetical protein
MAASITSEIMLARISYTLTQKFELVLSKGVG